MRRPIIKEINPALIKAHEAIVDRLTTDKLYFNPLLLNLPHGRGSCVSSFCAMEALNAIETSIKQHALSPKCLPNKPYFTARQNDVSRLINVLYIGTSDTIHYSGMPYFEWALKKLGLHEIYEIKRHKGYIERKGYRNKIEFVSILRFTPDQIMWSHPSIIIIDEAVQLTHVQYDAITHTAQCLNDRTGRNAIIMVSYHPEPDPFHWLNFEGFHAQRDKANYLRVHSTYKSVPREWLGETFFKEADMLKKENLVAYKHEYLGEPIW